VYGPGMPVPVILTVPSLPWQEGVVEMTGMNPALADTKAKSNIIAISVCLSFVSMIVCFVFSNLISETKIGRIQIHKLGILNKLTRSIRILSQHLPH
jgi:hypothetical protein